MVNATRDVPISEEMMDAVKRKIRTKKAKVVRFHGATRDEQAQSDGAQIAVAVAAGLTVPVSHYVARVNGLSRTASVAVAGSTAIAAFAVVGQSLHPEDLSLFRQNNSPASNLMISAIPMAIGAYAAWKFGPFWSSFWVPNLVVPPAYEISRAVGLV